MKTYNIKISWYSQNSGEKIYSNIVINVEEESTVEDVLDMMYAESFDYTIEESHKI